MRKRLIIYTLLIALLGAAATYAANGSGESLVSLSYLRGSFTDSVLQKAEKVLEEAENGEPLPSGYTEKRFKCGDALTVSSGGSVIVLAGDVQLQCSGAVIDASEGKTVADGAALAVNHRYLVGEDASAGFITTGKTSCMDYMGSVSISPSANKPDYNAMAEALKSLTLLRGSFTAYGSGFDLEKVPTRGAALIMFIRMLGEEEEALAYHGSCPFTDLDKNGATYPYVVYAYNKGYTTGYTKTEFRPSQPSNIYQYTAFILRAMGYSSTTNISTILDTAYEVGVITASERESFKSGSFLRADLVYLSFYALQAMLPGGEMTLADQLMEKGVFTYRQYRAANAMVTSARI